MTLLGAKGQINPSFQTTFFLYSLYSFMHSKALIVISQVHSFAPFLMVFLTFASLHLLSSQASLCSPFSYFPHLATLLVHVTCVLVPWRGDQAVCV